MRERTGELGELDLLVAEIALHEVVVGDDDSLDQRVVHRVLLGFHLGRNLALVPLGRAVAVGDRVVVQELDDAAERRLGADREVQRRDTGAEPLLQLVEGALERRSLAVELVDEDRPRDAALLGHLPGHLGLHLDALDRGDDEQREVGGLERGAHVADEVGVSRRVEQVHLVPVELERRQRQRDRDPAALFLGIEVAHGRAVLDLAQAVGRTGGEQQGLGQRGLAGAAVPDEGHVADVGRRKRLHPQPPEVTEPVRFGAPRRSPQPDVGAVGRS